MADCEVVWSWEQMEHHTWVTDGPDASMGQIPLHHTQTHTHIHTLHRQPTHIGALSKPLPYVGQTVIPNSLFFKRAKTDKELWWQWWRWCTLKHMYRHTRALCVCYHNTVCLERLILRSGRESRRKHGFLFKKKLYWCRMIKQCYLYLRES